MKPNKGKVHIYEVKWILCKNGNGCLMVYMGLNGNGYLKGIWVMNKEYFSLNA